MAKERRIGKLNSVNWDDYFKLGTNSFPYSKSLGYPDFSSVGVIVSEDLYGTGTLIAPNVVVTAAHVLRNTLFDPTPTPSSWKFILNSDYENASIQNIYEIETIHLHPAWNARLTKKNGMGDGDELGVDIALVILKDSVVGVYPTKLPNGQNEEIGSKVILSGYGNLVDGKNGIINDKNSRRVGGENILDRNVILVDAPNVDHSEKGGLLAVDFDSPDQNQNSLGQNAQPIGFLGAGTSSASPLSLEASSAVGDSGGPAFYFQNQSWRTIGVVSYGTSDSTYGDITVYTRISNHLDWIQSYLPAWSQAKRTEFSNWLELDWFGYFFSAESDWKYHLVLGWFYTQGSNGESFWGWRSNHLGWWWTGYGVYPYVYSTNLRKWIFVDVNKSSHDIMIYFDYENEKWIQNQIP